MAFLRRFDHYRERYDDPVGPLFVIARRMIADWYERQNNVPDLPGDDILGVRIAQIAQDRPNALGRADLRADLTKAINRLTPRQRTALQLYYVDGLDRSAAAQLMDITVDGVKKLISAALKSLRAAQDLANYQPSITISTPTMDSTRKEVRK